MNPPVTTFSWLTLLELLVILAGSMGIFMLLERRWTTQRKWVALQEWAGDHRWKFRRKGAVPDPLLLLREVQPNVLLRLISKERTFLQLQTNVPEVRRWNVLVVPMKQLNSPVAALRPVNVPSSLWDHAHLQVIPTTAGTERFVTLANLPSAAKALARSSVRGLLPADIGLMVVDGWVILDFSTRPFDPVELDRMLALMKQIGQMGWSHRDD